MQLDLRRSLSVCLYAAFPIVTAIFGHAPQASAQADAKLVAPLLQRRLQTETVVAEQLRHFMLARVPPLRLPPDATQWTTETERLRARELGVIYHGWPESWIDAPPKFEQVGTLESRGYRIRKLRYEVVPGMYSAALLYEPEHFSGKLPAVLNVHGHGPGGKAVEHKQKRCINQARRGMLALSLEWFGFGELNSPENDHSFVGHLDLVGANGLGLFYIEMRRGLAEPGLAFVDRMVAAIGRGHLVDELAHLGRDRTEFLRVRVFFRHAPEPHATVDSRSGAGYTAFAC